MTNEQAKSLLWALDEYSSKVCKYYGLPLGSKDDSYLPDHTIELIEIVKQFTQKSCNDA